MSDADKRKAALDLLLSMSDDELVAGFAGDPDLLKKAQRAVAEAKRVQEEAKRQERMAKNPAALLANDPKLFAKAFTLVESPFNDANVALLQDLLTQGLSPNAKVEGRPSLLKASMDYLATKDRVELNWPHWLVARGAVAEVEEVVSLYALYQKRGSSIHGEKTSILPALLFSRPGPWREAEADPRLKGAALVSFLRDSANASGYGSMGFQRDHWNAISTLVEAGCKPPSVDPNAYRAPLFWQELAAVKTSPRADPSKSGSVAERARAIEARIECFSVFASNGWLDEAVSPITEGLRVVDPACLAPGKSSDAVKSTPSRAFLQCGDIDEDSFFPIFRLICDYEASAKLAVDYDALGRSRLYFANQMLRSKTSGPEADTLLKCAVECLERGDDPRSVNAQSMEAKANSKDMLDLLRAAAARIQIDSAMAPASASAARRPPSL